MAVPVRQKNHICIADEGDLKFELVDPLVSCSTRHEKLKKPIVDIVPQVWASPWQWKTLSNRLESSKHAVQRAMNLKLLFSLSCDERLHSSHAHNPSLLVSA